MKLQFKRTQMKPTDASVLFFLVVTLVFTFNFKENIFSSAADSFFDYFQTDGESLVVGRLALSEQNGLTDHAGFLGWTHPMPETDNKYIFQYQAYQNGLEFNRYEGYYSQPGMQAFLFGLACKVTGLKGEKALACFRWIVSFCTALAFTAFLAWIMSCWGWPATVFTFICLLFSQWITVYGRNLFWVLSAFYLPFLVGLGWLHSGEQKSKHPLLFTFLLMFVSMFIKVLLTGFEYITTVMIMAVVPWAFYAIDRRWDTRKIIKSLLMAGGGVLSAVIAGIAWLTVQLSALSDSLKEGISYIAWSFGKRTHGLAGEDYDPVFQRSIESSQWEVLSAYLNDHALHMAHWFENPLPKTLSIVPFSFCILCFAMISYIALSSETIRQNKPFYRRQTALTVTLWLSLLAPLSWFVIFKGHSYIHTHMNPIVWYMPFMLFGFVLAGSTGWYLLRHAVQKRDIPEKAAQTTQTTRISRIIWVIRSKRKLGIYVLSGLVFVILLRLFVVEIVSISGSSMENSLHSGDRILVNKLSYGGRLPRRVADIPIVNIFTWSDRFRLADDARNWPYRRLKGYTDIRRNDIVVFDRPNQSAPLIKRIVGLPGETVELRSGTLWINNVRIETPSDVISGSRTDTLPDTGGWTWNDYGPFHLPDNHRKGYFVLGDNRDISIDSRHFGYITEADIVGKASF